MHSPDTIASRAATLRPFICSSLGGGLDAAWIHVAGELDMATSPELERALDDARARLVVLDLRDVEFMDCAGMHTIIDASARAREEGRRLILLRGTPNVDRVFALSGSADKVEIGDFDLPRAPGQLRLLSDEMMIP